MRVAGRTACHLAVWKPNGTLPVLERGASQAEDERSKANKR